MQSPEGLPPQPCLEIAPVSTMVLPLRGSRCPLARIPRTILRWQTRQRKGRVTKPPQNCHMSPRSQRRAGAKGDAVGLSLALYHVLSSLPSSRPLICGSLTRRQQLRMAHSTKVSCGSRGLWSQARGRRHQRPPQLQIKADRALVWFPVNQAGPDYSCLESPMDRGA